MDTDLDLLAQTPLGHEMRRFWKLESEMHYLNHGSFGATPEYVLSAQRAWQDRLERQPVRFMGSELPAALRAAAGKLAEFVGTTEKRLAFIENAASGVNAVLHSLPWRRGEEIVIANHAYPAIRHSVSHVAKQFGLRTIEVDIPFPLSDLERIVTAYGEAITPQTRLVIVDHVFSPLALVNPLDAIIAACRIKEVPVLVDGAHAPGMLPLELDRLGADWYIGNCNKWMLAPKGSAFLFASEWAGSQLHPVVISNLYGEGFPNEFDWQGTRDYSAWLSVAAAIDFLSAMGLDRYRRHLKEQVGAMIDLLSNAWQVALPAPRNAFGAMVTLPFPVNPEPARDATKEGAKYWHDRLWNEHRIEVPLFAFNDRYWIRVSAQVYNDISDCLALAEAISPWSR